jgi:hypothetical protein
MTHTRSRLVIYAALIIALVALMGTRPIAQKSGATTDQMPTSSDRLVVHEWGTFTSIADKNGLAVQWRPLNGPSDLPGFVYNLNKLDENAGLRHGSQCFKCDSATIRMETPVIYFYADRETEVSVNVWFAKGKLTEWYPQARNVYTGDTGGSIDWGRFTVLPFAQESLPVESGASHYYAARETDAALVRMCIPKEQRAKAPITPMIEQAATAKLLDQEQLNAKQQQYEKFLFYRGLGTFDLPLAATCDGAKVRMRKTGPEKLTRLIVFENHAGKIGYRVQNSLTGEVVLQRPVLDQTMDSLERELQAMLVAEGLYEKEAWAMINTWRDSWFEEGLRVFYIVPRKTIDAVLQLRIEPQPTELARVLVGRMELITPEMEQAIMEQVTRLGSSSVEIQSAAMQALRQHGRFAEPILNGVLATTQDAQLRARLAQIIKSASVATD